MSQSSKHFEEFKPHSKHKHLIFEHYFDAWAHKHGLREDATDVILYVDACAGRGSDDLGNHGSPLIAALAAARAQANVSRRRKTPFQVQVVAIENDPEHHRELAKVLAQFGDAVRTVLGTLEEQFDPLQREFPRTPSLSFIDPFGLDALPANVVRRALSGERHEALLLFADQAALRHFGAIVAEETRAERKHRNASDQPDLFPNEKARWVETLAKAAAKSRESLDVNREHAVRILNAAFGDSEWLETIEATSKGDRRMEFLKLYSDRLRSWGASHVLQIPIADETGVHAYTLIHASKSPKAYTAMKEAVAHAFKYSPLPKHVVEHMAWLVQGDMKAVETAVRRRFSSEEVRWTENAKDKFAPCVRNFVLEETPAFPFELAELKDRLKEFKLPGHAIVYSFPEEPSDVD